MSETRYTASPRRQRDDDHTWEHCGQLPGQHHSDTRCYTVEEIGHRLRFSQRTKRWPGPDEGCEEEELMAERYQKPRCAQCEETFEQLGVWTDEHGLTAIFFCPNCGKAFGAQLLRSLAPEELAAVEGGPKA